MHGPPAAEEGVPADVTNIKSTRDTTIQKGVSVAAAEKRSK